ncbi:AAA family ATPase [Leifsonia sp. 22587]|uniref:AAA family ATPase n=1 Tax=Leifsonia sp. 22587 TaxID=3453946 RepID=UPI003F835258
MTADKTERTTLLTPLSMIEPRRQHFLWANRAPMGTCTIFAGRGGEGKSTYSLHIAAQLTRGELEGEFYGHPQAVLLIGHEDDLGTTVAPRLIAANANRDLVYSLNIQYKDESSGLAITMVPDLAEDMGRIRQAVEETGAKLIIVDPLISTISGSNTDKDVEIRRALTPFMALAMELDLCVIAIMHVRKGGGDTRDLLSGSHAFRDIARSVIIFATDDESGQRVATIDKSNYSQARGDSFAFELITTEVPAGDEMASVARIHDLGASSISVSEIINREPEKALGEEIRAVVDCVNAHPEGIRPAEVAVETGIKPDHTRSYLRRAEQRGLIVNHTYGVYHPKAKQPVTVSETVTAVPPVTLNPSRVTSVTGNTELQPKDGVTLCPVHGTPTWQGTCGRCETAATA